VSTRQHHNSRVPTRVNLRFGRRAPLTDRLFLDLCGANPELRLERTVTGELIAMTPASSEAGGRNAKLTYQLINWVITSGMGHGFDSSAGFTLPNGAIRSPDASWISNDRWDALTPSERAGFARICPDFVVELRSTTDRLRDLRIKMREYRANGARLGWLIDPVRKVVEIYRPPHLDAVTKLPQRGVEVLTAPTTLSGEDVLPGFVLDLNDILT